MKTNANVVAWPTYEAPAMSENRFSSMSALSPRNPATLTICEKLESYRTALYQKTDRSNDARD